MTMVSRAAAVPEQSLPQMREQSDINSQATAPQHTTPLSTLCFRIPNPAITPNGKFFNVTLGTEIVG